MYRIIQSPTMLALLYEGGSGRYRQIFTDGRKLANDPNPSWLGYSVGHWQGDTLVVETSGFNDRSWLDRAGHPHSESLRVTERFRRKRPSSDPSIGDAVFESTGAAAEFFLDANGTVTHLVLSQTEGDARYDRTSLPRR